MSRCDHEEADSRISVHLTHAAANHSVMKVLIIGDFYSNLYHLYENTRIIAMFQCIVIGMLTLENI